MLAFFRVAALVTVLLSVPASSNSHWTITLPPSSAGTPYQQIIQSSRPTTATFVTIQNLPKYHDARRYSGRSFAPTSLFALSGNNANNNDNKQPRSRKRVSNRTEKGIENGELTSFKSITTPLSNKGTKKITKGSKSNGRIKHVKKSTSPLKKKRTNQSQKKSSTTELKSKSSTKSNGKVPTNQRLSSKKEAPSHESRYIQFSRVFQRHVVYQRHSSSSGMNNNVDDQEVIQSFQFLDDAVKSFPKSQVLAPKDLPFPPPSCSLVYLDESNNKSDRILISRGRIIDSNVEEEECDTTVGGMGLWTLCELEYDASTVDSRETYQSSDQAHNALRTLLQLVSSESSSFNGVPRHFFRLDPRRIAMRGHTPQSITLNHARIVNLLSCGLNDYANDIADVDGIGKVYKPVVGLAMDTFDVAFVMQNFPQLCLYDCVELENLVKFLLQPLPIAGSIPSVAMVADRAGDGRADNVNCKCLYVLGVLPFLCTHSIHSCLKQTSCCCC